ncbi:MAG: hypothetical protein NC453_29015 [Muribaculum sp.]|nr:hypothetical protein [Muribaculum sp.]
MFEQEYTPTSRFISCHTIIMGFIECHGNYFCDSISEIKRSLYAMSHLWEYETPYIEANGFTGEIVEDKNGKISISDGAAMWCVECRLSQAGINFVSNHKSLYSLKNLFNLKGNGQLQIKSDNEKTWQLNCIHEDLLRYMATRGYWPTKQYVLMSDVIVNSIKHSTIDYTDSISNVVNAIYELATIRINDEVLIDMQYHKGEIKRDIGIITEEEKQSPEYIEVRLSKAGFNYVITNNLVNRLWAYRHRS